MHGELKAWKWDGLVYGKWFSPWGTVSGTIRHTPMSSVKYHGLEESSIKVGNSLDVVETTRLTSPAFGCWV